VARVVVLDAGPLGLVTHPRGGADARAAKEWLAGLLAANIGVRVLKIADHELKRELLRAGRTKSVRRLDELAGAMGYAPLSTQVMRLAADYWARARRGGYPTAPDPALDPDVILAAQASVLAKDGSDVVVATTNVAHLSRFVAAEHWREVGPE
jgi:predicted nucleic acid-binding protein